jgi:hypothetical protein
MENKNIKKFYQQAPKPFNYVPSDLVSGGPVLPPTMSGLMRIDPDSGDIWVSAGNTLVSDWKLITGGGGGGNQGLQDVITFNPVLTTDNTVNVGSNSFTFSNTSNFTVNSTNKINIGVAGTSKLGMSPGSVSLEESSGVNTSIVAISDSAINIASGLKTAGDPTGISLTPEAILILKPLINAADDVTAAFAGVPVNGIYRTGSELKIRVS